MSSIFHPSVWVIAKSNFKENIRDRLLYGILIVALLVTGSSFFLSTISLEQNARVLQNVGITAIQAFALLITIFVATTSMARDQERRTLYLILSKPVSRAHYVLGKFLGMVLLLLATLLVLGGLYALGLFFMSREVLHPLLLNLSYSLLEISLLTSLAILFATFTAPLNATLYTIAFYIIGHSLTLLRDFASKQDNGLLKGIMNAVYYLFPNLEKFDVHRPLLYNLDLPPFHFAYSFLYWLLLTGIFLYLATLVMKKREV